MEFKLDIQVEPMSASKISLVTTDCQMAIEGHDEQLKLVKSETCQIRIELLKNTAIGNTVVITSDRY